MNLYVLKEIFIIIINYHTSLFLIIPYLSSLSFIFHYHSLFVIIILNYHFSYYSLFFIIILHYYSFIFIIIFHFYSLFPSSFFIYHCHFFHILNSLKHFIIFLDVSITVAQHCILLSHVFYPLNRTIFCRRGMYFYGK